MTCPFLVRLASVDAALRSSLADFDAKAAGIAWQLHYEEPDPRRKRSTVPCPGCGAFLHCRSDTETLIY